MLIVKTTVSSSENTEEKKDRDVAKNIAEKLVEEGKAACVNMYEIDSVYKWKGEKTDTKEIALEIKTTLDFNEIKRKIEDIHPYDLPEIVAISPKVSEEYRNWVEKNCVK